MGVLVIEHWMDFAGLAVHRIDAGSRRAYAFLQRQPRLTAQGAPDAYHPDDNGSGSLRESGWPGGAWRERLVADPHQPQRPLRQADGATAGYFVSTTALRDPRFPRSSPSAYLDAGRVPYLALPEAWLAQNGAGALGDFVAVHDRGSGRRSLGLIGDAGRDRAMGALSERMAGDLSGHRAEARTGRGTPTGPLLCLVFAGTRCEQLLRPLGGASGLARLAESLDE